MARLTGSQRSKLSSSQFALPGKRAYPIHDRAHAANAKARVAQHGTPAEKKAVNAAVAKKYPGLGKSSGKSGGKSSSRSSGGRGKK